ncbi:MAG: non-ribosomal peptide synthetase, partial [bacterium]|nr:non-ribosomal peptide synthetase [bacterium]
LARWLPDGNIEYLGRIDHQIKIRGFRIEIGEIENNLLKHPGIKEAVVLARETKTGDKLLCAYYVPANIPAPPTTSTLRTYLSRYLPAYMIPSYYIKLEHFPLTPNGKIDGKALAGLQISKLKTQTYSPPGNHIEKKLSEIWTEILKTPEGDISIDDNFFEIGGHSLKAT